MLIKLLVSRVGDNFSQIRGDEIEVDSKEGCSMVDAQQAVPVGEEAKKEYAAHKKAKAEAAAAKPVVIKKREPEAKPTEAQGPTIDELGLNKAHAKALREAGIETLEQLHGADLASIKGLGEKSAEEIRKQIAVHLSH